MKGTYTVQGPTDRFVDFVTSNFEDCNVLIQKPGDHVIEITVFDYELNSYDGVVGVSDYFKPGPCLPNNNETIKKIGSLLCDKTVGQLAKDKQLEGEQEKFGAGVTLTYLQRKIFPLLKELEVQIETH